MPDPTSDANRTDRAHRRGPLSRPVAGRYIGGVSAGIGQWFGVDPLLPRIAFVVLSLFGGTGIVLYAAAWALLPEEGAGRSPLQLILEQARGWGRAPRLAAYAALGLVGVWALSIIFGFTGNAFVLHNDGGISDVVWLAMQALKLALVVGVVLLAVTLLSNRRRERTSYQYEPPTMVGDAAVAQQVWEKVHRTRRRRSPLGWLTIGIAAVAAGICTALSRRPDINISTTSILAVVLLVLGLGVLTGAWIGRARWLLLPIVATSIALIGPVGAQQANARSVAVTPTSWRDFGMSRFETTGTFTIDLRELAGGIAVDKDGNEATRSYSHLDVRAGRVVVIVPDDARIRLSMRVDFGRVLLPDARGGSGVNVNEGYESAAASTPPAMWPARTVTYDYDDDGRTDYSEPFAHPKEVDAQLHIHLFAGDLEVSRVAS